jgi:hypothetical protein
MPQHKIIVRIKGGIGNQLFCYAAARRLALVNDAELVIDDVTGFVRDRFYSRCYMLDRFNIPARKATKTERLEPFERYRRCLEKCRARGLSYDRRKYIEQDRCDFDARILHIKVEGTLYLDGLWQSEGYFIDVQDIIREDLRIIPPTDAENQGVAERIRSNFAVAIHVRWFDGPDRPSQYNVSVDYYRRAIEFMEAKFPFSHYFLFSDNVEAAKARLSLPADRSTFVSHNRGDANAYADLWLMTQCKHFITANSTFSWWGAWLKGEEEKIVLTPNLKLEGKAAWGFKGLIPDAWLKI